MKDMTTAFECYLGRTVCYAEALYRVEEVCVQKRSVRFLIRNEDGEEARISTKDLMVGLLEEVDPDVFEFA